MEHSDGCRILAVPDCNAACHAFSCSAPSSISCAATGVPIRSVTEIITSCASKVPNQISRCALAIWFFSGQAKHYSRLLLLTAYAGDWAMNLSGLFFLNKLALSWFNLSPEAYGMALELMVWFNVVSLILWPSSFTLPNILRAAGDAAFTMTVSVISMWVFRVAFCYLMVLKFHCGLLFIWLGMFLDWAMRSLFFCVRFVRGRWMEQKVI